MPTDAVPENRKNKRLLQEDPKSITEVSTVVTACSRQLSIRI